MAPSNAGRDERSAFVFLIRLEKGFFGLKQTFENLALRLFSIHQMHFQL